MSVNEIEPNNSTDTAQTLDLSMGNITVNAMMGPHDASLIDADFYEFKAYAGDELTLNIDNGYSVEEPINTVIVIYSPAPEYKILRYATHADTEDAGSVSILDARIDHFKVPATGIYTVAVSIYDNTFHDGGLYEAMIMRRAMIYPSSDYQLKISGVSVPASERQVNIEVRPGSNGKAPINPRSKGMIPVAINGSNDFSVSAIDTSTLSFGYSGDEQSLSRCNKTFVDTNGNGHNDLLCHFDSSKTDFSYGDLEGVLRGKTRDGQSFEGRAYLKVVPAPVVAR
jgi:hypothetical protein